MKEYDVIVIGGGLLGCFAARNLARYDLKIALLEKREDICTGISRSNTAIVYSGCDIKPGTVKAAMTVKSAKRFENLCEELGVKCSMCGSIMVSFGENGTKVLQRKYDFGSQNGVNAMRFLSPEQVLELEPNLSEKVQCGLYIPDTGTVMPWDLCIAAAENAAENGVEFIFDTEVFEINKTDRGYEIHTTNGSFFARGLVNCAGLQADTCHEMVCDPAVRIVPTACDYVMLDTKAASHIKHIIAHEPEQKGKGLTLVPTVDGNILIGSTERQSESFDTDEEGLKKLQEMVSQVMPTLPMEHIIRSFGAVRPNPYSMHKDESGEYHLSDKSINDFCIMSSPDSSMISLIGIKTPGLTCANELGMHIAGKLAEVLQAKENADFNPRRIPPVKLSDMSYEERHEFTHEEDSRYSRIICRCRSITEGEIVEAIHRFPKATTFDALKRRTGIASGRCQGSFCTQRIIEILAEELGCEPEDIQKDGEGSYFFAKHLGE